MYPEQGIFLEARSHRGGALEEDVLSSRPGVKGEGCDPEQDFVPSRGPESEGRSVAPRRTAVPSRPGVRGEKYSPEKDVGSLEARSQRGGV